MMGFPLEELPHLKKGGQKEKFNFTDVLEAHKLGVKWTDEKPEIEVSLTVELNNNCTDTSLGKIKLGVQIPTWPGHGPLAAIGANKVERKFCPGAYAFLKHDQSQQMCGTTQDPSFIIS